MPDEQAPTVWEWVEKAEQDLVAAVHLRTLGAACPNGVVCFLVQQCVEKYLKGLLTAEGVVFPKTHDIVGLVALLPVSLRPSLAPAEQALLTPSRSAPAIRASPRRPREKRVTRLRSRGACGVKCGTICPEARCVGRRPADARTRESGAEPDALAAVARTGPAYRPDFTTRKVSAADGPWSSSPSIHSTTAHASCSVASRGRTVWAKCQAPARVPCPCTP